MKRLKNWFFGFLFVFVLVPSIIMTLFFRGRVDNTLREVIIILLLAIALLFSYLCLEGIIFKNRKKDKNMRKFYKDFNLPGYGVAIVSIITIVLIAAALFYFLTGFYPFPFLQK